MIRSCTDGRNAGKNAIRERENTGHGGMEMMKRDLKNRSLDEFFAGALKVGMKNSPQAKGPDKTGPKATEPPG